MGKGSLKCMTITSRTSKERGRWRKSKYGLSLLTDFLVFDGSQPTLYQQFYKSPMGSVFCLALSTFKSLGYLILTLPSIKV